jgi:hypothetical protein
MTWALLLGAIAAIVVLGAVLTLKRQRSGPPGPQVPLVYRQVKPLSAAEQMLYWRLREALPECVILSQVTFSRFMKPDTGGLAPLAVYRALQNRIAQKTLDFLVCLPDFTVVAAVELDDASHRADADRQRDELLNAANITVIRVTVDDIPSAQRIREAFTA